MKKIHVTLIAFALAAVMLALIAVPALAQAQKVDLQKAVGAPGGGFVVFNGPAGNNQFECELVLKGVEPNTAYDVYLLIPPLGVPDFYFLLGTITTSAAGNANLHHNCPNSDTGGPLPPGPYNFSVRVRLAGSLGEPLYFMSGTLINK